MKSEDIDKLVLLAVIFTFLGDAIALFTELANRRLKKHEDNETQKSEQLIVSKLHELERRIQTLEAR